MRYLPLIVFLALGCEDVMMLLELEYDAEPVIEACTKELCFSEAVPLLRIPGREADAWPTTGLHVDEHQDWCEYHGWRMPTHDEVYFNIVEECLIDYYHSYCSSESALDLDDIFEHYDKSTGSQVQIDMGIEFMQLHLENGDSEFSHFARCVKPIAWRASQSSQ